GRRMEPAIEYPHLGAVAAKLLGTGDGGLPGHIQVLPGGGGFRQDAAFLGPKFASVVLGDGKPPADLLRPGTLTETADQKREQLRKKLNDRFAKSRRTAATDAYAESYDQAERVVRRADVF